MTASSAGESTVLLGFDAPIGASVMVMRERQLVTVVRLNPYCWARVLDFYLDLWSSARIRGVVRALP